MTVWLAWHYDYEQTWVVAVGETQEAAAAEVKRIYADYPVEWEEHSGRLHGTFGDLPGKCVAHTMWIDFDPHEVATLAER